MAKSHKEHYVGKIQKGWRKTTGSQTKTSETKERAQPTSAKNWIVFVASTETECQESRLRTTKGSPDLRTGYYTPNQRVKAYTIIQSNKEPETGKGYVMDAFKNLSLNTKATNTHRLEQIKKKLHPKYRALVPEDP